MLLNISVPLPPNFRSRDFLAFHSRDNQAIAEEVKIGSLRKGIVWASQPACMTIEFEGHHAYAQLHTDGTLTATDGARFESIVNHMLGLTQSIEDFERAYQSHPLLGPLIRERTGLRVPQSFSVFEALSWAVTGQQITVSAAVSLRRKLIQVANIKHSSGLACYPDARTVANLNESALRQAGFSRAKTHTLLTLSQQIEAGELSLELGGEPLSLEAIIRRLLKIRGIGPWTVNYALLRGLAWLDGSLHGDAAVKRGLKILHGASEDFTEKQTQEWLADFSPWRALVAAHLWAMVSPDNKTGVSNN